MKYGVDLLNRTPQSGNSQNNNLGGLNQHNNFGNLCLIQSCYNKLEGSTRNLITDRKFLNTRNTLPCSKEPKISFPIFRDSFTRGILMLI